MLIHIFLKQLDKKERKKKGRKRKLKYRLNFLIGRLHPKAA